MEPEDVGGALDDDGKLLVGVVVEPVDEAEAGAQRGSEHAGAGGGSDEGEFGKLQLDGAGGGAGVDDDIEPEVFHGGVEVFLDGGVEAVDLVDEEDVAPLEVGEDSGEVACFLDLGTGGGVESGADGSGDDVGESGFSQAGRAGEEDVFENVTAALGGSDHKHEPFGDLILSVEVLEAGRPQGQIFRSLGGVDCFLKVGLRHVNLRCGSEARQGFTCTRNFVRNGLYRWGLASSLPPSTSGPMKVLSSLASAKRRHADCQVVKRKGTLYVINKTNPRFKARQGSTKGTKMSKKGVN